MGSVQSGGSARGVRRTASAGSTGMNTGGSASRLNAHSRHGLSPALPAGMDIGTRPLNLFERISRRWEIVREARGRSALTPSSHHSSRPRAHHLGKNFEATPLYRKG